MQVSTMGYDSPDDMGANAPKIGSYHVLITRVDEDNEKYENTIIVDFEVLDGTIPNQEGRVQTEFMSTKTEGAMKRVAKLLMVCGLIGGNEVKEVDPQDLVGKDLVIEVAEHEWKGKKRNQIPYLGFWKTDHPDVKDVPKGKFNKPAVAESPAVEEQSAKEEPVVEASASGPNDSDVYNDL